MKIERLETHDRLLHFKKDQEANIFKGAEDCLKRNPDALCLQDKSKYIYIFAHPRTADDGVTKRMLWQPRLSKPNPQTNSYLFRAQSHTDIIEVCWLIPPREMWSQYERNNITESEIVNWSIGQFRMNKEKLSSPHPDDYPEEMAQNIYMSFLKERASAMKPMKLEID